MDSNYLHHGYSILSKSISTLAIDQLLNDFCQLIFLETKKSYSSAFDTNLCCFLATDRAFQSYIYNKIRETSYLTNFIYNCGIIPYVKKIFPDGGYLLEKIIFRIDLPLEISELAVWHQDYHYVQGNEDVLTVWIPLQDVNYVNGCLSVMPKSHLQGYVPHSKNVLLKKFIPENIYHQDIRYVEMNYGDCLLFHALLLHSSNLNLSNSIRYSIQARFSPIGKSLPPAMGKALLIT